MQSQGKTFAAHEVDVRGVGYPMVSKTPGVTWYCHILRIPCGTCRIVLTFMTQIMKPGKRFQDTPTVILGHHYLSHRELHGEFHRGDQTRSYLQEICAYDPVEAPITPKEYVSEGHCDIATWHAQIVPKAFARVRKEGIMSAIVQPYVEIEFDGVGTVKYMRHDEEYSFNFPSLILSNPQTEYCPLDLEGTVQIMCEATGLQTELRFKPWREEYVKGEVSSLLGDGRQVVAKIEGNWDSSVSVSSMTADASGVLFSTSDDPPPISAPPVINLSKPGPQTMCKLWSAILESILYVDSTAISGAASKKVAEMIATFPMLLRHSLMYEVPENPQGYVVQ